jgi:hypothetical protein
MSELIPILKILWQEKRTTGYTFFLVVLTYMEKRELYTKR